jgi:hypothetical protein
MEGEFNQILFFYDIDVHLFRSRLIVIFQRICREYSYSTTQLAKCFKGTMANDKIGNMDVLSFDHQRKYERCLKNFDIESLGKNITKLMAKVTAV